MESKGDEICGSIYNFINKVAEKGQNFAVSMIFKKVMNGDTGYTMMSRASYDASHTPKLYRNFITESEASGNYYKKIFDESPSRPKILMNKYEINSNFKNTSDIDYSQYIALPISCKGNIIGIIQIVGYNNSFVSNTKSEILRLCDHYLSLGTNIMLLTDKNENIHQIVEDKNELH